MHLRLSIAAVFLFAQLSLSWAAGPVMDMSMDMGDDTEQVATHAHAPSVDVVADASTHAESHEDCDCNVECQVSAMTLPALVLVSAYAAPPSHPAFVARTLPPGTVTHPYRPPANS